MKELSNGLHIGDCAHLEQSGTHLHPSAGHGGNSLLDDTEHLDDLRVKAILRQVGRQTLSGLTQSGWQTTHLQSGALLDARREVPPAQAVCHEALSFCGLVALSCNAVGSAASTGNAGSSMFVRRHASA